MSCESAKSILKNGIENMLAQGKISTEVKTAVETFIDTYSEKTYNEYGYSNFDQTASTDYVFNSTTRTASNVTGLSKTLQTNEIEFSNSVMIKSILVKSLDKNITIHITLDGTNWFSIDETKINEIITSTDNFRIRFISGDNVFYGFNIMFENIG